MYVLEDVFRDCMNTYFERLLPIFLKPPVWTVGSLPHVSLESLYKTNSLSRKQQSLGREAGGEEGAGLGVPPRWGEVAVGAWAGAGMRATFPPCFLQPSFPPLMGSPS